MRPERQVVVPDVLLLLERPERPLVGLNVTEQADLPEFLPDQIMPGGSEEVGEKRVRVEDAAGVRGDEQDAVLGRLEEAAVTGLGECQGLGRPPPLGRVLDRQQNEGGSPAGRGEAPGVQDHRPEAETLEFVLHCEVVEMAVAREDFFEQLPQPRDVPLVVPEFKEELALGLRRSYAKRLVKRPVGGLHPQPRVEDHEGLADRLDDRFGERQRVLHPLHGPLAFADVAEDHDRPDDGARGIPDRGGPVVDAQLGPIPGEQDGVIGQGDGRSGRQARLPPNR
ncbi:hypothetical protein FRUB_10347 [Fimbriiglobus ruber]|uniref:Uncharacterized protein n=1 Tax=Fimbriiglobus ruber TaxID=1908690 RepID=A0A225DAQ2_9BACT|nr:hypothetical protein FRUB_10347 [Fimbriiglobus ruber]